MRKGLFLILCLLSSLAWAQTDVYFKAMQDEMSRTQKQLFLKEAPKPYFISYHLFNNAGEVYQAVLGELVNTSNDPDFKGGLTGQVHMVVGDKKENSNGFLHSYYFYAPNQGFNLGNGYDALRLGFWGLSDLEYREMLEIYSQKEAFKRQKKMEDTSADFAPAKQGVFVEEEKHWDKMTPEEYEELVKALSNEATKYPHLESASAQIIVLPFSQWYLNNQGGKMSLSFLWQEVSFTARLRNKDGFKQTAVEQLKFVDVAQLPKEELMQKADQFYKKVNDSYAAQKAEPYIGPVVFAPAAAWKLIDLLFVSNISNTKPLLQMEGEDPTAGGFKDKIGQRVFAKPFIIEDKPLLREYKGTVLGGFLPVDAEGVPGENLLLVKNGKLLDLPFSRSLTQGRKKSNGHARMSSQQRPRAGITNLFITPQETFTRQELEQKLLDRCRELDLEYGYIVESMSRGKEPVPVLTRIYVKDGRKEPIYGAKIVGLTTRSLRDILTAGDDETVFNNYSASRPRHSITVPSLLVDEIELTPTDKHPDRKPFVSKPR